LVFIQAIVVGEASSLDFHGKLLSLSYKVKGLHYRREYRKKHPKNFSVEK